MISFRLISLPEFPKFDLEAALLLTENFCFFRSLENLDLSCNPSIGDYGCAVILRVIQDYSPRISIINLNETGIAEEGIAALRDILLMDRLKFLKLARNRLKSRHFCELALGLSKNTKLTVLKLNGNLMDAVSCRLLAPFVRFSKSLTILDISENPIGPAGCIEMARALARNNNLKRLNLSHT